MNIYRYGDKMKKEIATYKGREWQEGCPSPDLFSVTDNASKQTLEVLQENIITAMQENPAIIQQLHEALRVIQKDQTDEIGYERIRNFARHRVPLKDIATDIKNFQNRRKPYSEYSAQGIVDAVKRGEFKRKMFTPALLRRDPHGVLYVLAGHSRHEAFKRLSTTDKGDLDVQAYCKKHNCHFDELPSLILNDIDFEDAKMVALMSNALATAETDVERSDVYRHMRTMGKDKRYIEDFGRKCEKSNRSRIRSFSHLAPNGMAMDMLYAFETGEDSNYIVKRIAYRIGELRRKNHEISDIHESELFDRLLNKGVYGKNKNKGEINKMDVFIDIIEKHIHNLKTHDEFAPDKPLNMSKIKDISYVMKYYYETLTNFRSKKNVLMQEFHTTRRKISQLKATTDISEDKRAILKKLEEQFETSFKAISESEDVHTATEMLFDIKEVSLTPDEEIARCEKIQQAILAEIKEIEKRYYQHRSKKDVFQEMSKTVRTIDFTANQD